MIFDLVRSARNNLATLTLKHAGKPQDCLIGLDDSCASPFIGAADWRVEGETMPTAIGLLFVGLVVRAILGAAIVVAVLFLAWKLGKVADAYAHKLAPTQ